MRAPGIREGPNLLVKVDETLKASFTGILDPVRFEGVMTAVDLLTQRERECLRLVDQHFSSKQIARELGMSVSGFHHHFKSVTSMSPLQFQKHLRLQEARRLMLGEDMDAASAAFRVGYHDPSHFSREYKRHFGAPPHGDIASLRSSL